MPANSPERVIVGMSGGVDSSVAAFQLLTAGYDVHGLFMNNWEDDEDGYCQSAQDYQDARQVCGTLGIPLHKVDFAEEYRERVFSYFLEEIQAGRTPNPDVLCNREIKFGTFREYAIRLGARYIATGHYVRVDHPPSGTRLLKGLDRAKDQSYFLNSVPVEALRDAIFPIGEMQKAEVRSIARQQGFDNFGKKDSTGICFIGERHFRSFLETYLPATPGDIRNPDGELLGRHDGLMYYTLGQRQGLGIGGRKGHAESPWYVAHKNLESNTLTVVQGHDHPLLYSNSLRASDGRWIGTRPENGARLAAKTRYRQKDHPCTVTIDDQGNFELIFDAAQRAVTPGQFAVLYDGEQCLGGGVIDSTMPLVANQVYLSTGQRDAV
ncbi:MAG: tRNA 2-thiouridine(34) synthase MnmA [Gammaproteobacteria bacterium]|nr:tRNA 2-thiouridine(34) synthase MnmA [Gammaproteobacteria bacterium]